MLSAAEAGSCNVCRLGQLLTAVYKHIRKDADAICINYSSGCLDVCTDVQDVEAVALLQQRGVHVVAGAAAASAQALLLSPVLWQLLLPTHAIEQSQFSAMVEMVSHDRQVL